jgi:hypothetical protein
MILVAARAAPRCATDRPGTGRLDGRPVSFRYTSPPMAQLSPGTEQGYSPPTVRQFSVFLDNKVGKLLELLQMCEQNGLQIAAFSVLDSSDHAVVRMIFTNADAARHILRRSQYTFAETDLVIVELGDGQSLSTTCLYLLGAELNVRFAYPSLLRGELPAFAICVDDNHLAGQILLRKRFRLLAEEDLAPAT